MPKCSKYFSTIPPRAPFLRTIYQPLFPAFFLIHKIFLIHNFLSRSPQMFVLYPTITSQKWIQPRPPPPGTSVLRPVPPGPKTPAAVRCRRAGAVQRGGALPHRHLRLGVDRPGAGGDPPHPVAEVAGPRAAAQRGGVPPRVAQAGRPRPGPGGCVGALRGISFRCIALCCVVALRGQSGDTFALYVLSLNSHHPLVQGRIHV